MPAPGFGVGELQQSQAPRPALLHDIVQSMGDCFHIDHLLLGEDPAEQPFSYLRSIF